MDDSRRWLEYFRSNQGEPEEIPWERSAPPSPAFRQTLIESLQQFQLGENASGLHFLELARAHARVVNDPDFPEAIALFIAEEQRHSSLLARYLRSIGAPLLKRHWIHSVFRRIRHWAGLETKVTVLVTAEIMAVPYYRAVLETTRCPALKAICHRVLREESQHLLFQGNTLRRLRRVRPGWWVAATGLAQELLLAGTCLATWAEHRRIFSAAGDGFLDVWFTARVVLAHVQRAAAGRNPLAYREPTTRMSVSQ
jgi:hypothetical protein